MNILRYELRGTPSGTVQVEFQAETMDDIEKYLQFSIIRRQCERECGSKVTPYTWEGPDAEWLNKLFAEI